MTERIIRKFVDVLSLNGLVSKTEYENYVYVLLGDVESFLVIISILFLGVMTGQAIPTICFLLFFLTLRRRTGGFHLNSFLKCYIASLAIFVVITMCATVLSEEIFMGSVLAAIFVILLLGSVNHPNINMSEDELQESKTLARIIALIEFLLILFFECLENMKHIVRYAGWSIILCAVLLVLAKLTGQEVKKNEGKQKEGSSGI